MSIPFLRVEPEDFEVEELALVEPSGSGPHTWLLVEKRLADTARVARQLARAIGVPSREVGFAGRKDVRAVARQWFSVPRLDPAAGRELVLDRARVLDARRHDEKLRTGWLAGNRFSILVRGVEEAVAEEAARRLEVILAEGLPNRYGRQRYGQDGQNVERGRRLLAGERLRCDRRLGRLFLSALQSAVFDEVVRVRQARGFLDRLLPGDLVIDHRSDTWERVDDPDLLRDRVERFEVSASGPIFGTRVPRPSGEPEKLEAEAMATLGVAEPIREPRGYRLPGSRRALRVRPDGARLVREDDRVRVDFELPAGSYATVLLAELFPAGLRDLAVDRAEPPDPGAAGSDRP